MDALKRRHHRSAIVCRMLLNVFAQYHRDYSRKHIGATFEELLVAMAVRCHDAFGGGKPITISGISRMLNIPRSNVSRAVVELIRHGVVKKEGRGFRGRSEYLAARINADYFKRIVRAVIEAADELKKA